MPVGKYKHKSGVGSNNWRGGKPKCFCGKTITYKAKNCHKHRPRSGKDNPSWKETGHEYSYAHKIINRLLGKPKKCEVCGTVKSKRFEWASKRKIYSRNPDDWIRVCSSCHTKADRYKSINLLEIKKDHD